MPNASAALYQIPSAAFRGLRNGLFHFVLVATGAGAGQPYPFMRYAHVNLVVEALGGALCKVPMASLKLRVSHVQCVAVAPGVCAGQPCPSNLSVWALGVALHQIPMADHRLFHVRASSA